VRLWDVATGRMRSLSGRHAEESNPFRFSPDGRMLAYEGTDGSEWLCEVATGKVRHRLKGHQDPVRGVSFAPNGRTVVSASADGTLLVWDVRISGRDQPGPLRNEELTSLWKRLAGDDAEQAYQSVCRLSASPAEAVPFLAERLRPVAPIDAKRISRLIDQLTDRKFAVRREAARELEKADEQARTALERALGGRPELEFRRRVEEVLAQIDGPVSTPELLQGVRAVEVLEYAGTQKARSVLQVLAGGAPTARLTREAQAALKRLTGRPASAP